MTGDDIYDATALLAAAAERHGIQLSVLVAETGLWANPSVHRRLMAENGLGVFFPNIRRYRVNRGERRGQQIDGVTLDNNSYANHAIKRVLGGAEKKLIGYEACHIWPNTCFDEKYHTAIANLVLLPRALAGLSDHDRSIQQVLQYRAYELFDGWHPGETEFPTKPSKFPVIWLDPLPYTSVVELALTRRRLRR